MAPNPELRGFTVTGANMLPQARCAAHAALTCGSMLVACFGLPSPAAQHTTDRLPIRFLRPHHNCAQAVIEEAFQPLFGRTLNYHQMVNAVGTLNRWYEDKGVLGQVRCAGRAALRCVLCCARWARCACCAGCAGWAGVCWETSGLAGAASLALLNSPLFIPRR